MMPHNKLDRLFIGIIDKFFDCLNAMQRSTDGQVKRKG